MRICRSWNRLAESDSAPRSVQGGNLPLSSTDPKAPEFFENAIRQGNHMATSIRLFFPSPTPIVTEFGCLQTFRRGREVFDFDVDRALLKKHSNNSRSLQAHVLIVVETTVPPGTCENGSTTLKSGRRKKSDSHSFRLGYFMSGLCRGPIISFNSNFIERIRHKRRKPNRPKRSFEPLSQRMRSPD